MHVRSGGHWPALRAADGSGSSHVVTATASVRPPFGGGCRRQPLCHRPHGRTWRESGRIQTPAAASTPLTAPPQLGAAPAAPAAPGTIGTQDLSANYEALRATTEEGRKQLQIEAELLKIRADASLIRATSTKAAQDELNSAQARLGLQRALLGIDTSLSDNERESAALAIAQRQELENSKAALKDSLAIYEKIKDKLSPEAYELLTEAAKERHEIEKQTLAVQKEQLVVAQEQAFIDELGEIDREAELAGAGFRAGFGGQAGSAYENELRRSGNVDQATDLAKSTQKLEENRLAWESLEQGIAGAASAIASFATTLSLKLSWAKERERGSGRQAGRHRQQLPGSRAADIGEQAV